MIHLLQSFQGTLSSCTLGNSVITPNTLKKEEHLFQHNFYFSPYLENPLSKHLNTNSDPAAISQFLWLPKLGSFWLQLKQFSDGGLWHMGGELINLIPRKYEL